MKLTDVADGAGAGAGGVFGAIADLEGVDGGEAPSALRRTSVGLVRPALKIMRPVVAWVLPEPMETVSAR